jgi:hypothetical protein
MIWPRCSECKQLQMHAVLTATIPLGACSHHIVCGWPDRTGHTPCLRRARNSPRGLFHLSD